MPLRRLMKLDKVILSSTASGAMTRHRRAMGPPLIGKIQVPPWELPALVISGTTLTGAGAALASCDVHLYDACDREVQQTTSDGSGLFTFNPINNGHGPFYIVAYKAGAPDRAGTTKNVLYGSTSVNVYLRDPTVADSGGSAVFRPVGSPVVRRISI